MVPELVGGVNPPEKYWSNWESSGWNKIFETTTQFLNIKIIQILTQSKVAFPSCFCVSKNYSKNIQPTFGVVVP